MQNTWRAFFIQVPVLYRSSSTGQQSMGGSSKIERKTGFFSNARKLLWDEEEAIKNLKGIFSSIFIIVSLQILLNPRIYHSNLSQYGLNSN